MRADGPQPLAHSHDFCEIFCLFNHYTDFSIFCQFCSEFRPNYSTSSGLCEHRHKLATTEHVLFIFRKNNEERKLMIDVLRKLGMIDTDEKDILSGVGSSGGRKEVFKFLTCTVILKRMDK